MNQKSAIVDLILSRSAAAVDKRDSWNGSESNERRASFASDRFPHRALRGSTALHYACLLGDMEIVGALLRHGAKWTIPDSIGLLPEYYVDISSGDGKKHEFKCLCEEETLKRAKKLAEEEESKRSEKLAEEEELKRAKKLVEAESKRTKKLAKEEALKRAKELAEEEESERSKKLAKEEELKQAKKLEDEEALLKRRMRQSK